MRIAEEERGRKKRRGILTQRTPREEHGEERRGARVEEAEVAFGEAGRKEREPVADQFRDDAEIEFIDEIVLEKGAGELPPPMCQMFLPFCLRRRSTKDFGDSLTTVTSGCLPGSRVREKT
jgi:hypothetical protein